MMLQNSLSGGATQAVSDSARPNSSNAHNNIGAIVGGTVGAAGAVAILGGLFVLWRRNRFNIRQDGRAIEQRDYSYRYGESHITGSVALPANTDDLPSPNIREHTSSASDSRAMAQGFLSVGSTAASQSNSMGGSYSTVTTHTALSRDSSFRQLEDHEAPPSDGSWQYAVDNISPSLNRTNSTGVARLSMTVAGLHPTPKPLDRKSGETEGELLQGSP